MSNTGITAAELDRRIANIRTSGDMSRRGVNEAIAEAQRKFGFGTEPVSVLNWLDEAECAAGMITCREMRDRMEARSTPITPLRWS